MDNAHKKWLTLSISILVFMSYMGLATTFRYAQMSVTLPLMLIVMMPVGEWVDRRFAFYRKATTAVTVVFICALPFIGAGSGLMDTVITLFIYIQVYSMVHNKSTMEYYHIILMSFFLLIAALVMSPSASMGFVLFFFILAAAASLLLTDWHRQVSNAHSVKPDRRNNSHKFFDTSKPSRSLRIVPVTALLGVLVLVLTSVLFVFMPRTGAGVLGRSVQTQVYTTGLDEQVSLDVTETITSDSSPVMRVQFTNIEGGQYPGELYWRSTTMDKYTGSGWIRQGLMTRSRSVRRELSETARFRTVPLDARDATGLMRLESNRDAPKVIYEIFVDSYPEGGFPLLSVVDQVAPKDATKNLRMYWENGGDYTVSMNYRGELQPYFVAQSRILIPTPSTLQEASDDYLGIMVPSDFRLLTEHTLQDETLRLVEEIVGDSQTAYDKVLAVQRFFNTSEFTYTRSVPALDPEYPIDSFVNDVKLGHCELYASAMALMVRSEDIPARVVSGFRGGDWDDADNSYTITNAMAHLWVEVFFPGIGWVTFDPTPSGEEIERTFREQLMTTIARYSLKLRVLWLQYVVGFSPSDTFTMFRDQTFALISELFGTGTDENGQVTKISWPDGMQGVLLGATLVFAALVSIGSIFTLIRRFRNKTGRILTVDQEKVRELYASLRTKLIKVDLIQPNATAEEVSESLEPLPESTRRSLRAFIQRYHDVRFGLRALTVQEHSEFKSIISQLDLSTDSN